MSGIIKQKTEQSECGEDNINNKNEDLNNYKSTVNKNKDFNKSLGSTFTSQNV